MQLNVREAAKLLNVSEKSVYRWVKQRKLPAFKINARYRFSRAELLEWATSNRVNVSSDMFCEPEASGLPAFGLADAIQKGGIHYRIGGHDKASVLRRIVDCMRLPEEVDREFLFEVLVARESLGSTAIGDGMAIPHVRNPIVLHIDRPLVAVCFLEEPIEFDALDGVPVHTLFAIVSPTTSAHLSVLSRLSFALRKPLFADVISRRGTRDEIVAAASSIDRLTPTRRKDGGQDRGASA